MSSDQGKQSQLVHARLATCCALLLLLPSPTGCSFGKGTAVLAEVLAIGEADASGDPVVGDPILLPRTAAPQIAEGSRYSVPEGKAAVISFIPGIFAVARRSAEFTFDRLRLDKEGNETETDAIQERTVLLHMTGGAATFFLPWENISGQSTIEIALPHGRIVAGSASLFHVDHTDSTIRITCAQLALDIITEAGETHLVAKQMCTITPGADGPVIETAEADTGSQSEVAIAAADQAWISRVMLARRSADLPWRTP